MKLRRSLIAAASAVALTMSAAPAASAQTYPEPLNQVMNELRKVGGDQAPNILLVPVVLSSLETVGGLIGLILVTAGVGSAAGAVGSAALAA